MGGQGEYGHCNRRCPQHESTQCRRSSPAPGNSLGFGSTTSSGQSSRSRASSCSGSDTCREVSICAGRLSNSELNRKRCTLSDGTTGLCCNDINALDIRTVELPSPPPVSNVNPITSFQLRGAVDVAESFFNNVTATTRRRTGQVRRNTGTFFHSKFQKAKPGAARLDRLGVIAARAARNVQPEGEVVVRQADISNSQFDQCYDRPRCNFNTPYRTADGSCNSRREPLYGRSLTPLSRIALPDYADGVFEPRANSFGSALPSARILSNDFPKNDNPSRRFSVLLMVFGQFLDHDVTHVPIKQDNSFPDGINCCQNGFFEPNNAFEEGVCFPIRVPRNDRSFRNRECMNFVRSMVAMRLDCLPSSMDQLNQITHWIDGSNIYGSDDETARNLRSRFGGRLRMQNRRSGRDLLPRANDRGSCRSQACFLAGDGRTNEQPNLALFHTVFAREHNRVASTLQAVNSHWSDERLYQESRRIVVAQWQHIIYNEYLPILLGRRFMTSFGLWPLNSGFSRDYRDDFDPRITNEFASAAFRIGHTMIPSLLRAISASNRFSDTPLGDLFFDVDGLTRNNGIEDLVRGMTQTPVEGADGNFSPQVSLNTGYLKVGIHIIKKS